MYTLIRVNDGTMPSPVHVLRMGIPMIASALQRAVTELMPNRMGKLSPRSARNSTFSATAAQRFETYNASSFYDSQLFIFHFCSN